ncbi:MAG: prolyl oligopeptidase family serine peptidase [Chitinophagaceae bacterium]
MSKGCFAVILIFISAISFSQSSPLTVEKIMRDQKWIGTSPTMVQWGIDGKTVYFNWNPDNVIDDSTYYITLTNKTPVKASVSEKQNRVNANVPSYNTDRSAYTYNKDGDIFYVEAKSNKTRRVTETIDMENNPQFSFNQTRIVYNRSQNLYSWNIQTGETVQLTNIRSGANPVSVRREITSQQEEWLKNDQLQYFDILRARKAKNDAAEAYTKNTKLKELRSISIDDKTVQGLSISPDGRFISYRLFKTVPGAKNTIIPNYVTESGFTTDIPGRTKVGSLQGTSECFIYDREKDTVLVVKTDSLPGIKDLPDYVKDYPRQLEERKKKNASRSVIVFNPVWSAKGTYAVFDIRSDDNKDRWLWLWNALSNTFKLLDRQRDEAWIGGPGISNNTGTGWIDETTYWFQSEATGYSHLYTINIITGEKKALTSGNYEVQQARLSTNKKYFYISTNEVHTGELQFYRLSIANGKQERITTMTGANTVTISPDEKYIAFLYSYSNKPWELYLQENKPGGKAEQITTKAQTDEFKAYPWRDPEVVTFTARDGATVYARLYKPANPHKNKPAVLFVHGAGYLQNAHKWWSVYYKEFMFNNLLADNGYYVLDIDYRGSSGYGRDWRTGIYRYMGGKDLSDNVDGVNYLIKNYGVDPKHVGLYGGSYGGFIALMGLFTQPDVFAAGAGLRSVTDWANYNHGYTSNILNEPYTDSIAYRRSSPYYFAEGLKGHLLMCHGMVDVNVHFQDIVKLSQRLIELGKDNWELAVYPMEDHGFVEASSWTDEYKRVFKLFEEVLKK